MRNDVFRAVWWFGWALLALIHSTLAMQRHDLPTSLWAGATCMLCIAMYREGRRRLDIGSRGRCLRAIGEPKLRRAQ